MPGCFGFQISTRFDSIVFRPQNAGGFCRCKIQRGAGKTGCNAAREGDNVAREGDNAACNEGNAAREGDNATCNGDTPLVTRATPPARGIRHL